RKNWHIENVTCEVHYDKQHATDCEHCEDESAKLDTFTRTLKITSNLDEKQLQRILQIADKCPVHKTLHSKTQIVTKLLT
ncbi:MAG: OsmC family protein, partial [Nonlabens sp.]|nr:OsmC family protein [Nonlabens sp.]